MADVGSSMIKMRELYEMAFAISTICIFEMLNSSIFTNGEMFILSFASHSLVFWICFLVLTNPKSVDLPSNVHVFFNRHFRDW